MSSAPDAWVVDHRGHTQTAAERLSRNPSPPNVEAELGLILHLPEAGREQLEVPGCCASVKIGTLSPTKRNVDDAAHRLIYVDAAWASAGARELAVEAENETALVRAPDGRP